MSTSVVFGPVPSRRLGRSLGINNIVAPKVCSYACIYCQVGKTSTHTCVRQGFYGPEEVYNQVRNHLKLSDGEDQPDYLTFVANGEPTLDINLDRTIQRLRTFGIPIAVITNATLLHDAEVTRALMQVDWVSVKIDAADEATWRTINLPVKGMNFALHIAAIRSFAKRYKGILCTETMLIEGKNDSENHLHKLAEIIAPLHPGVAYLSIPTRPPSVRATRAPEEEQITLAWNIFTAKKINTELLTGFEGTNAGFSGHAEADILNITAVHPLRDDMLEELLANDKSGFDVVEQLISSGKLKSIDYNSHKFYIRRFKKKL